jgi:hypothetical protein
VGAVRVQIHQAGVTDKSFGVNHVEAQFGGDVRLNRGDLSIRYAHIGILPEFATRVEYLAAFDQNVKPALPRVGRGRLRLGSGERSHTQSFDEIPS